MISLLAKLFIKDSENYSDGRVRTKYGLLCGAVGIVINIILFGIKFFAGVLTGAVSVTADAFNNLADAGSSVVTMLGFRLAEQKPDSDHPFGHGRFEYISGFIVSLIIMLVGFELGKSSVEKIISPEPLEFSITAVIILVVSILAKLYMFLYNRRIGKRIESASLLAVGTDSISDCVATSVVLLCMLFSKLTGVNIDGYCGLAVAIFIMRAGVLSAVETVNPLLGQRPEKEFVDRIIEITMSYPSVTGVHDLVVHNYGPGNTMVSLHAEVPENSKLVEIHDVIDTIEQRLSSELGCSCVIHMDPGSVDDPIINELKHKVEGLVLAIDKDMTIHDFRVVPGANTKLIFDVVVPDSCRMTPDQVKKEVDRLCKILDESYQTVIKTDRKMF